MGAVVQQTDKPFSLKSYLASHPGTTDFDLISVKMTDAFTGKIELAVNLNASVRRIGRLEVDSSIGDGVHVGAGLKDCVIESFAIEVHDLAASVLHWDGLQVLGGYRVIFRNGYIRQTNPADVEGRCVFMSGGHDAAGGIDVQDVVFEDSFFISHREPVSTKTQVFTQALSLRSGLRRCFVGQGHGGGDPVLQKTAAVDEVSDYTIIPIGVPIP